MAGQITDSDKRIFLKTYEQTKGLSKNTLDAYDQDINEFIRFLRRDDQPEPFDAALIHRYLAYLKRERGHKHATLRRRLVTLRAFAAWLRKMGHIEGDPFAEIALDLRPPKRLPRPMEWVDVRAMLTSGPRNPSIPPSAARRLNHGTHSIQSTTNLAIRLMIATGVRVGELTRISLSNISNDGHRIRIHGKGNKERNVFVGNPELRAELQQIKQRASQTPHDGDYLLLNANRRRLTEQALRRRLRILGRDCNLDTRVTPHRFRHSAATFLIEEGVDIRFVQRLLGHSSIATTEIYTRVSDTALMKAMSNADPLGKMLGEFT